MGKLKISAPGKTPNSKARARGKLFKALMTQVLSHYGYRVSDVLRTGPDETGIDILGVHNTTGSPFYADCRCYATRISESDLQAFYGKYMIKWHGNKQCHGLLVALPGLDADAAEFYRKYIEKNPEVTTMLYEENEVLTAVSGISGNVGAEMVVRQIPPNIGTPDDYVLLYTERGAYWIWFIVSYGKETPDRIAVFDSKGALMSGRSILDYLTNLHPELADFENISRMSVAVQQQALFQDRDEIVEVRGGPECFAYQFPASPGDFVGRKPVLKEVESFVTKIIKKTVSKRALVLEAPSGWGKSSMLLAIIHRLQKKGHFAVAIDSRSASSSRFILRVIDHILKKFGDFGGKLGERDRFRSITDLDSAIQSILDIGQLLAARDKIMFIGFDPFENLFSMPDVLKQIKALLLKIAEKETPVVLGFTLNKDLVLPTPAFSKGLHEAIADNSKTLILPMFSRTETHWLLKKLSDELGEALTSDLRSFLIEFSRGYPWLLKMLCFHVKLGRQSGVPQPDIAANLMNIEELFHHDLQTLSQNEKSALLQIAQSSPPRLAASSDGLEPQIAQNLSKQRLILNIGNTVDVYGDVFRHYLNTNISPHKDRDIIHAGPANVLEALKSLYTAGGSLEILKFKEQTGLSAKQFFSAAKDMDLLGLVRFTEGTAAVQIGGHEASRDLKMGMKKYLQDRLRGVRPVLKLLKILEDENTLPLDEVVHLLQNSFPYTAASEPAWLKYARILGEWMDIADLTILDKKNRALIRFDPTTEIREHDLLLLKRRGGKIPRIHYTPVENVAIKLVKALRTDGRIDWSDLSKSTIYNALASLEDLGFIARKTPLIKVLPKGLAFVENPDKRPSLFAEGALQLASFSIFLEILESHQAKGNTLLALGYEFEERLGAKWKAKTAETIAKIMLDWARRAKLAPGVFAKIRKGPIKGWKKKEDGQLTLF